MQVFLTKRINQRYYADRANKSKVRIEYDIETELDGRASKARKTARMVDQMDSTKRMISARLLAQYRADPEVIGMLADEEAELNGKA